MSRKLLRDAAIFLAAVLVGIHMYGIFAIKVPIPEMDPANLTVHKAPGQSEAMEHPAFKKEEYVPVIPEGENLARKGKASASSFTQVYTASRAIDGKVDGPSYWEAEPDSYPNTLTVDLTKASEIHAVRLRLNPMSIWAKRTQTFSVKISDDGENFDELVAMKQYTFDPDRGNEVIIEFETVETRYVQLEFTENSGAGGGQAAEFEIYGK
ncbi:MAG: discoidin domain-containing protein [Bacillota bacterium]